MLTRVDIANSSGNTLQLPLLSAAAGYAVRDIEGLDPVKAALTYSSMAQLDGGQAQNARRDVRNITMKLGLVPDYISTTVDSLRQNLFDYLMPKANIGMTFWKDGAAYALASGQVESLSNSMFTADPEVDVSIICYNPDFTSPTTTTQSLNTTNSTDTTAVSYTGTSDTGVIFTLSIDRTCTAFSLYNTSPDNTTQIMQVVGTFASGDVVTINTIPGSRGISLTRASITTSILFYLDPTSSWVTLQKGVNAFRTYFNDDTPMPYTLAYTPLYGGI